MRGERTWLGGQPFDITLSLFAAGESPDPAIRPRKRPTSSRVSPQNSEGKEKWQRRSNKGKRELGLGLTRNKIT
jgi:hypothetical protein